MLAFLVVLAPLIFATAVRYVPLLEPLWFMFNFLRIAVASVVLIVALVIVHKWLPAGRRRFVEIAPGIVVTLVLWLIAGELFGDYLARLRLHLCHLLRRPRLGDDRAGVSLSSPRRSSSTAANSTPRSCACARARRQPATAR